MWNWFSFADNFMIVHNLLPSTTNCTLYLIGTWIFPERPEESPELLGVDGPVPVLVKHGEHGLVHGQQLRGNLQVGATTDVSSIRSFGLARTDSTFSCCLSGDCGPHPAPPGNTDIASYRDYFPYLTFCFFLPLQTEPWVNVWDFTQPLSSWSWSLLVRKL